nr:MAG TPA: hypothetical protein [Caudoviricetes sp.]
MNLLLMISLLSLLKSLSLQNQYSYDIILNYPHFRNSFILS